jgi:NAD(P)-dependent dehydrogenase (short-subunit alcohol dehydrogenase family)
MDLGIKGRRAIVTGGSSGIGFETARQLLEEGARVLITGRDENKLNIARDDLAKRTGDEVHALAADMTKEGDIAKMVETAKQKLGGVDILVNNAGTMYFGPLRRPQGRRDEKPARDQAVRLPARHPRGLSDDEGVEMGPHRQHHRRRRQGA